MARCLNTTFLIDQLRDRPRAAGKAKAVDRGGEIVLLSAPALSGFLSGAYFAGGTYLTRALELLGVRDVLPLARAPAGRAARISAELRRQGNPLSMLDLLIATTTLENGHVRVTREMVFYRVPGLAVETY